MRDHIRSNVIGYLALFCFLTAGTAGALPGRSSVDSGDLRNGAVRTQDLANGATARSKIARDAVGTAQVAGNALGPADIDEASLDLATGAFAVGDDCTGEAGAPPCGSGSLTLERRSRLLLVADVSVITAAFDDPEVNFDSIDRVRGSCELLVDGVDIGGPRHVGEIQTAPNAVPVHGSLPHSQGVGLNRVTVALSPGSHTFGLRCTELDGDMAFEEAQISAVALDDD